MGRPRKILPLLPPIWPAADGGWVIVAPIFAEPDQLQRCGRHRIVQRAAVTGTLLAACLTMSCCANAASTVPRDAGLLPASATIAAEQTPTLISDNQMTPLVATAALAATATPSPTPVPTLSSLPTVPPAPEDEPGVSYGQPAQLPAVAEEDAIGTARTASGALPEMATLPREQFSAVYVLWTDLNLNVSNALGTPVARSASLDRDRARADDDPEFVHSGPDANLRACGQQRDERGHRCHDRRMDYDLHLQVSASPLR
jgi:hypothetical protein